MISVSGFLSSGTFGADNDDDDESADMSRDFLAAGLSVSTQELLGTIASTFEWGSSGAEKIQVQN